MKFLPLLCLILSPIAWMCAEPVIEHGVVYDEPGQFAGWPANGNCWSWGEEILILHTEATYHYYPNQHSFDRSKPVYNRLSRSTDGGRTWTSERTDAFSVASAETLDHPMDVDHPDFAMRIRDENFWYTLDRGHRWKGPYRFPDFDLEYPLTSRTEYRVYDEDTIQVYLSAKWSDVKTSGDLQDRAFSAVSNNAGESWEFQGWMTHYPYQVRSVMPSVVNLQDHELLAVVRRRLDAHEVEEFGRMDLNFIEAEYSRDNGRSWEKRSVVAFTDLAHKNGNPPAMVRLQDGRVAVMYGFRGHPYGIRAKVSEDGGKTWGHEIILRDDGLSYDLGYPEAVLLPNGKIFVCYYIATPEREEQHIAYTIWEP